MIILWSNRKLTKFIKDPFFDERTSGYDRIEYIPSEKIELDCDMEQLKREVELNCDVYKKILDEPYMLTDNSAKAGICDYKPRRMMGCNNMWVTTLMQELQTLMTKNAADF